jgi:hypothetical protein
MCWLTVPSITSPWRSRPHALSADYGKHYAGQRCDVHVGRDLLQFWVGSELLKTVTRTSNGEVPQKNAARV